MREVFFDLGWLQQVVKGSAIWLMMLAMNPDGGAATRTASLTQHDLSLDIGYAVNGSVRLYFSTYDGSHTWARYQTGVGWSGELRPSSSASTTYRSDYDIYSTVDGLLYGYGSITVNLPSTDSDGDLLPDFLDRSRSGSASLSGSATEYLIGEGTSIYNLSGSLSRSAGSRTGSYLVGSSGGAQSYGNFTIAGSSGTLTYDTQAKTIAIQVSTFDGSETVSGQTTYTILDQNRIRVNGFAAPSSAGDTRQVNTFELTRQGNRYVGRASVADGNIPTPWVDYNLYHIKVVDGNDSDGDGIPDLSDTSTATSPTITVQPLGGSHLGGAAISLSVTATGAPVPAYQWSKDGGQLTDSQRIAGSRASTLVISGARRADGGNYSVRVSNSAGAVDSTTATIRVRVPQICDPPVRGAGGDIVLRFGDRDGEALVSAQASLFALQWSTNLVDWQDLLTSPTASGGKLEVSDTGVAVTSRRFYRVLER